MRYSGRFGKVSAQELDVTAVVPDSVDRAVDGADARKIGERAIDSRTERFAQPRWWAGWSVVHLDASVSKQVFPTTLFARVTDRDEPLETDVDLIRRSARPSCCWPGYSPPDANMLFL